MQAGICGHQERRYTKPRRSGNTYRVAVARFRRRSAVTLRRREPCSTEKLARGTVAPAAMNKRGLQSSEAMGEDAFELLDQQLAGNVGKNLKAKFKPTING